MSLDESVVLWSGRAVVLFTALAAISGVLLWAFGNRASAAREAAFAQFKMDAEARIAEAAARSAEASTRAVEAKKGTANALVTAAAVNLLAGKLEQQVAQHRQRAPVVEPQTPAPPPRNEPQRLSLDQRVILLSAMQQYPGTPLEVWKLEDGKASIPSDDLIATLKEARWALKFSRTGGTGIEQYGLVLSLGTPTPSPPMAAMISGFHEAGIPITVAHGQGPKPDLDALLIGRQPVGRKIGAGYLSAGVLAGGRRWCVACSYA